MQLAIFDLDNTLIAGDSDHLWGEYLVSHNLVDKDYFKNENDRFLAEYIQGSLDIMEFLRFQLSPLKDHSLSELFIWRKEFLESHIKPVMLDSAKELLRIHREQGHYLLIITATNRFITEPISKLLGVDDLIATEAEIISGQYTGKVAGIPSYSTGKVDRLNDWLEKNNMNLDGSYFYSDSHNDLPLLKKVTTPVAVDPDEKLKKYAKDHHWKIISLR